jgi:nucleotide-binding universal stress UspA family protein
MEAAMTPIDILAVLTGADEQGVMNAANVLSRRRKAHIAALHLAHLPEAAGGELYVAGNLWAKLIDDFREASAAELSSIKASAARLDAGAEVRQAEVVLGTVESTVAQHAMHADLTLMQRPDSPLAHAAFEGALFSSGRPVLLVPPNWAADTLGKRIMVAWKSKREAARALADAAVFLQDAEHVVVVTVDAKPNGDGAAPGRDICRHLARRGVEVELRNADGLGRSPEDALLEEARHIGADLIVMGGYGQSRLREFVFGGVTRALTRTSPVPLLLSH